MRRISRIERSVDLLRVRANTRVPSPYLCLACMQRTKAFSTTTPQAAGSGPGFTEKLRQRIWGTDSPPGAKDPYAPSQLGVSPQKVQDSEVEKESPTTIQTSADYQPADTWHGLEVVGDTAALFRQKWDAEHQFEGFLPPYVMNDTAEITANLRRAVVEVLAQRQAGRTSELPTVTSEEDLTRNVKLGYSESGLTLDFGTQERFEYLVQSLASPSAEYAEHVSPTAAEEEIAADGSAEDPLESATITDEISSAEGEVVEEDANRRALTETSATTYDEVVAGWDPSWLQMPLDNPEIKFAILKRTLQLTGIRISDALISNTRTVEGLLSHMIVPAKPRKLVDRLAQKENLITLPNVNVFANRITPIDKERTIGRWKIIEKELEERGLPVTGKYSRSELRERRRGSLKL